MSGQHAPLAPSSAYRWANCHGSVALIATLPPREDTPEAIEGTTAHWVVASRLLGVTDTGIADACPETNLPVTHEMRVGAEIFVEHLRKVRGPNWRDGLHIEEHVLCHSIHKACDGTPDVWGWDGKVIDIGDYKFGHGYVEEFENLQMISYFAGVLAKIGNVPGDTPVRFHICQPRHYGPGGPVRMWVTTVREALSLVSMLAGEAHKAMSPDAQCRVGPWCDNCEARAVCVALQQSAHRIADVAAAPTPFNLSPSAMGFELSALTAAFDLLKARIDGLKAEAENVLRSGKYVPGWEMKPGRSRLKWHDEQRAIELGVLYDKPIAQTVPCTPTQAKDMGIDEAVILTYASREPAAMKLAPVNFTDIQKVLNR